MLIIALFLINAGMNFAISLILASLLGPESFGLYAIAFSAAVVTNIIVFDWIRLSATRFYSDTARINTPEVRATLDILQAGMSILVLTIVSVLIILGVDFGIPTLLIIITSFSAIISSLYDYRTALVRARFLDKPYAKLILVKNIISLILMVTGAWYFKDVNVVLSGYIISMIAALLTVRSVIDDKKTAFKLFESKLARKYLVYGSYLVIAHGIYQLMPFVNRSVIGAYFGFAEAGFFALSSDVGFRLFAAMGSSMDILLFQKAVQREIDEGLDASQAQISHNLLVIIMLTLPACLGYMFVLPVFADIFVPDIFKTSFVEYGTVLAPSLFLLCLIQYGFTPIFQIKHKTGIVSFAAFIGLIVNICGVTLIIFSNGSSLSIAYVQTFSMICVAIISGYSAYKEADTWPRIRDVLLCIFSCIIMAFALWPLRSIGWNSYILLPFMIIIGVAVYGALVVMLNVGGSTLNLKSHALSLMEKIRGIPKNVSHH